jgi:hypothetical protein
LLSVVLAKGATLSTFVDDRADHLIVTGWLARSDVPPPGIFGTSNIDGVELSIDLADERDDDQVNVVVRVSRTTT